MRKTVALLLFLIALLTLLCSCGAKYTEIVFAEAPASRPAKTETAPAGTDETPEEEPAESPGTGEYAQIRKLKVLDITSPVKRNGTAVLKIQGKPGAEYRIEVYYDSGKSKAAGLTPKSADALGIVTWTWRVDISTTPGLHRIVVTGGGDSVELYFETT